MENDLDKDNPLRVNRSDRPTGAVPEPRPANADVYERAVAAIRGRTEDPAADDRESRLLLRCPDSKARAAAIVQ